MKASWIIGLLIWYTTVLTIEAFITGTTYASVSGSLTDPMNQSTLIAPAIQDSNIITAIWTAVTGLKPYLTLLVQILTLWSPTVFADPSMVWFWWYVCFPTDVAMWVTIFMTLRGIQP